MYSCYLSLNITVPSKNEKNRNERKRNDAQKAQFLDVKPQKYSIEIRKYSKLKSG